MEMASAKLTHWVAVGVCAGPLVTDEEWAVVQLLVPTPHGQDTGRVKPHPQEGALGPCGVPGLWALLRSSLH